MLPAPVKRRGEGPAFAPRAHCTRPRFNKRSNSLQCSACVKQSVFCTVVDLCSDGSNYCAAPTLARLQLPSERPKQPAFAPGWYHLSPRRGSEAGCSALFDHVTLSSDGNARNGLVFGRPRATVARPVTSLQRPPKEPRRDTYGMPRVLAAASDGSAAARLSPSEFVALRPTPYGRVHRRLI